MSSASLNIVDVLGTSGYDIVPDAYTPNGGAQVNINVLLFNPAISLDSSNGNLITTKPKIIARTIDIVGEGEGDVHVINGTNYYTVKQIAMINGETKIYLSKDFPDYNYTGAGGIAAEVAADVITNNISKV